MSLGSYRPANLLIRTDSKRSLRLFDMDPDRPFYFFESGWDTEVVFGCSITDWTVYRHTFRKDCTFKNEICAQTDRKNISIKLNKDI